MICNRITTYFGRAPHLSLSVVTLLLLSTLVHLTHSQLFKDVSRQAGLKRTLRRRRRKYGGAVVADLDGDGWPDLLFGHHNDREADLYFNSRNGRFRKSKWGVWRDTHGITPFRFNPRQRALNFIMSSGGARGNRPSTPSVFRVQPSRYVKNITRTSGVTGITGRGRSAIVLNLRRRHYKYPHVIVTNARLNVRNNLEVSQYGFESTNGKRFTKRAIPGFARTHISYGSVFDVDNDGFVELITWHDLTIHRVIDDFKLRDITRFILPKKVNRYGVVAVAELDINNDGRWDLFVARTNTSDLRYLGNRHVYPYLLRNVGGRLIDVTRSANIPRITDARGVTHGDFDNDGWTDLIITRHEHQDMLLRNKGDGSFKVMSAGFKRPKFIRGDMATAVDYDRNGRLDVVLSEGDYFNIHKGGYYRLMKNVIPNVGNFIVVTVRNAPGYKATSLHAVVYMYVTGRKVMRRVASPGTAVSNSYVETLHFGLGSQKAVGIVKVRWIDGSTRQQRNVKAGSRLIFGVA